MILFVVAAALSFAAFVERDLQRQIPFWAPAVAIIALSIGREPSVVFLSLFIVPTLIMGLAVFFKRLSPTPFLVFAVSDIVLGIAFSIYQSKTALWTLPEVAGWGPAAGIAAAAGVLRMAAATGVADTREGGLISLGWWQGAMLAYWAGAPGVVVLIAGGLLLWAAAAYDNTSSMTGMALAGGTLAIAAGLGAGLFGVLAIGFAATGLALGERSVSAWAAGILPVSIVTTLPIPGGEFMAAPALLFPVAWAVMAARLGSIKAPEERIPVLGAAAAVVGLAYIGAVAEAVIDPEVATSSALAGLPIPAVGAMWAVLGGVVAVSTAAGLSASTGRYVPTTRPTQPYQPYQPSYQRQTYPGYQGYQSFQGYQGYRQGYQAQPPRPAVSHGQFSDFTTKLVPPVGWFVFGVAILVAVRLFLAGFRTGFL